MNKGLVDIISDGNMSIPLYLLKNYKKFNIEIGDFIFLMYLYNRGNKFLFNPEDFGKDLNIDNSKVMSYISNLTDKGLIRVEVIKNDKGFMEERVILDDFYSKLSLIMMDDVNEKKASSDNTDIYELIEKEFGRTLGPIEIEIIKTWLENNFSEELIREALKEATMNGVPNLRYIDKILYEWSKKGIRTAKDVEDNRKARRKKMEDAKDDSNIDLDTLEWNWFDGDE